VAAVSLPNGYHTVNPFLVVGDAEDMIEFLVTVFSGVEQGLRPDGRIDHADVLTGDSLVILASRRLSSSPLRVLRVRRPRRQSMVGRNPCPRLLLTIRRGSLSAPSGTSGW